MIFIVGGVGKTGSSALACQFSDDFGIRRIYGGGFMRREAMKAGFVRDNYLLPQDESEWDIDKADIKGFREFCIETNRNIDFENDKNSLKEMVVSKLDGQDILIESKTMARILHSETIDPLINEINNELGVEVPIGKEDLLKETKAAWIHADLEVRAKRALVKTIPSKLSVEGIIFSSEQIQNESEILNKRQIIDGEDYARIYGMTDYPIGNEIPPITYGLPIINNGSKEAGYTQMLEVFGKSPAPISPL